MLEGSGRVSMGSGWIDGAIYRHWRQRIKKAAM